MNATARTLGAYDTFVETPSGLDGWRQLTSAFDMALILRAALSQPRFLRYDTVARAFLPAQLRRHMGRIELDNQNEQFLTTVKGALAAKTGYTDAAQHTFVGAVQRNGHRYGVVLLRAQRWPLDQWQQATRLITWATRLPAGTAPVGRLESAATAVSRPTGPAAASTSPVRATAPISPSPSPKPSSRPSSTGGRLLVLAVLVGAALLLGSRISRHRRR
jgi:D-alanyl-D-alanine carboxypeptidase (penicillin-binding protein 5/6)